MARMYTDKKSKISLFLSVYIRAIRGWRSFHPMCFAWLAIHSTSLQ